MVQHEYKRLKKDPSIKYYTYVLLLRDNKFYVGNTDNIYQRMYHHLTMSPCSSLWVRKHGPVQRIVEICKNSNKDDELYKTLYYSTLFGWENVRGSYYCKVESFRPPAALAHFTHNRLDFEMLSRAEINQVENEVRAMIAEFGGAVSTEDL
jgi:predicted GIY-YIG superfamily endonuclease